MKEFWKDLGYREASHLHVCTIRLGKTNLQKGFRQSTGSAYAHTRYSKSAAFYLHWRPFIRRHHRNPLRENRGEIVHGENAHHSDNLPILRLLTFHIHKATYILLPTPFFSSPSHLALTFPSLFSFFPAVSSCAAASSVRAQVGSRLESQYTELQNLTTTCRQGCIRIGGLLARRLKPPQRVRRLCRKAPPKADVDFDLGSSFEK